jgi:hypothetical protein
LTRRDRESSFDCVVRIRCCFFWRVSLLVVADGPDGRRGSAQPLGIVRGALFALVLGLIFQPAYGGLVYFILTRAGLWNSWMVSLAYLLPVILFSCLGSDTTQDLLGTIPWLGFALIVVVVSWFFAPPNDVFS